ncbi:MAG: DUF5682 family protein, partial [Candidatus Promineifilaceae bacterium]
MDRYRLFGIRHHGPGSAAALRDALEAWRPDAVLVEGPPDGDEQLHWLADAEMVLPAALLVYRPDQPQRAAYYPYTDFSPETQAIRYAQKAGVTARFADLPLRHLFAGEGRPAAPPQDPFQAIADAGGFRSYEEWWNLAIEQRRDSRELFAAVLELMTVLRAAGGEAAGASPETLWAERREAAMRQILRETLAVGHDRVAFVCGAWHAPALADLSATESDQELLAGLPQVEVNATWVPWTYGRLSMQSGYGAGVRSPGWYDHLWRSRLAGSSVRETAVAWLARVAGLLRQEGFTASPANIIETVRLAEAVAAMRELPFPGLPELNEATIAVLCEGRTEPMALIQKKLIVGERLGRVPSGTPMVPLQRDLLDHQEALALPPDPEPAPLLLDLRDERDLMRSRLLHRLRLLDVPWGEPGRRRPPRQQGAAQELWQMAWRPDFPLRIIEASIWGNTVLEAAEARAAARAEEMERLADLTALLDPVIQADLPDAVAAIVARIEDESAVSSDIPLMMAALPPLARVLRYGSARRTEQAVLQQVVDGLLTRVCIGLPSTCATMDDEPALKMAGLLTSVAATVHTLRDKRHLDQWHEALGGILAQPEVHGLLDGRASRLLLDDEALGAEEAAERMSRALRRGSSALFTVEQAQRSAAWLDGFLEGSELLLIHDRRLWSLLDSFINQMADNRFVELLPLLRRSFARYSKAARRQLQERAQSSEETPLPEMPVYVDFAHERAAAV